MNEWMKKKELLKKLMIEIKSEWNNEWINENDSVMNEWMNGWKWITNAFKKNNGIDWIVDLKLNLEPLLRWVLPSCGFEFTKK